MIPTDTDLVLLFLALTWGIAIGFNSHPAQATQDVHKIISRGLLIIAIVVSLLWFLEVI